jgi:hypothetical protein
MADTLLVLNPIGVTLYSSRGLHQTVDPIEMSAVFKRTVLGDLDNIASPAFQKYKSTISCEDQTSPALGGVFPGLELVVDCVFEFAFLTGSGSPNRPVVSGSTHTIGPHTLWRPQLTMQVISFDYDTDEWGATINWRMDLEES